MRKQTPETFWARVDKRGPHECWNWRGTVVDGRYGQLAWHGKICLAHRISAWLDGKLEDIEDFRWVLHKCDNGVCVNPNHLFVGTARDNTRDMLAKGRHWVHKGEASVKSILTEKLVEEIRQKYATGDYYQDELATMYKTSQSNISLIVLRKHWK